MIRRTLLAGAIAATLPASFPVSSVPKPDSSLTLERKLRAALTKCFAAGRRPKIIRVDEL